eukprot:m.14815 g.14815  ORF g.14815 m.14815 type:complete len:129 (-) comp4832_c0_seq1:220-606(-)
MFVRVSARFCTPSLALQDNEAVHQYHWPLSSPLSWCTLWDVYSHCSRNVSCSLMWCSDGLGRRWTSEEKEVTKETPAHVFFSQRFTLRGTGIRLQQLALCPLQSSGGLTSAGANHRLDTPFPEHRTQL